MGEAILCHPMIPKQSIADLYTEDFTIDTSDTMAYSAMSGSLTVWSSTPQIASSKIGLRYSSSTLAYPFNKNAPTMSKTVEPDTEIILDVPSGTNTVTKHLFTATYRWQSAIGQITFSIAPIFYVYSNSFAIVLDWNKSSNMTDGPWSLFMPFSIRYVPSI